MQTSEQLLRLEDYCCLRAQYPLFHPLNLTLNSGQSIHIQASNGVGKTSLLRALYGMAIETIGAIYWRNTPITNGLAAHAQYLNDRGGHTSRLTVVESLEKMLILAGQPTNQTRLRDTLHNVGLDNQKHFSDALSKGQKKRLHIARLLLINKPLWLLDEPFDGLDQNGEALLVKAMATQRASGGAILYTSHLHSGGRGYQADTDIRLDSVSDTVAGLE